MSRAMLSRFVAELVKSLNGMLESLNGLHLINIESKRDAGSGKKLAILILESGFELSTIGKGAETVSFFILTDLIYQFNCINLSIFIAEQLNQVFYKKELLRWGNPKHFYSGTLFLKNKCNKKNYNRKYNSVIINIKQIIVAS
jgi:hypothetical protein